MANSTLIDVGCHLDHPAVLAWSRLQPERVEPAGLVQLKGKLKTAVFRLDGVGPDGSNVIAKRCRTSTARVERIIYEHLLARLPLPTLRIYGFVPDGEYCWLFLEDAGSGRYEPSNETHRALVAEWLGAIHGASFAAKWTQMLPRRDASHYLGLVHQARDELLAFAGYAAVTADDRTLLNRLAGQCDCIESRWEEAERCFEDFPPCLVHGDLVIKNLRVSSDARGPALLVFDWEMGGWGVPATDLAQSVGRVASPDLKWYCAALQQRVLMQQVQRLAHFGTLLRVIDKILWETIDPGGETYLFFLKPLMTLRRYEPQLAAALHALDWRHYD
jgi:hypothetical protein